MPLTTSRCLFVRTFPTPIAPVHTVRPGDELAFLVEVPPAEVTRTLTIELLRGEERRHGREYRLTPSGTWSVFTFQIRWRDRSHTSTRLTCRVWLNGQLIGSPSVLLTPTADAQGRFADAFGGTMGEHTRAAFLDAFGRLLNSSQQNGDHRSVLPGDGE